MLRSRRRPELTYFLPDPANQAEEIELNKHLEYNEAFILVKKHKRLFIYTLVARIRLFFEYLDFEP